MNGTREEPAIGITRDDDVVRARVHDRDELVPVEGTSGRGKDDGESCAGRIKRGGPIGVLLNSGREIGRLSYGVNHRPEQTRVSGELVHRHLNAVALERGHGVVQLVDGGSVTSAAIDLQEQANPVQTAMVERMVDSGRPASGEGLDGPPRAGTDPALFDLDQDSLLIRVRGSDLEGGGRIDRLVDQRIENVVEARVLNACVNTHCFCFLRGTGSRAGCPAVFPPLRGNGPRGFNPGAGIILLS